MIVLFFQLTLECHSNHPIENVMVTVDAVYPIMCNKPSCVISSIGNFIKLRRIQQYPRPASYTNLKSLHSLKKHLLFV